MIVLGTVQAEPLVTQVTVLSLCALAIVIGLVAGIVKLDDAGLYLLKKSVSGKFDTIQRAAGSGCWVLHHF
jgi:predicted DNA repair protein MutK